MVDGCVECDMGLAAWARWGLLARAYVSGGRGPVAELGAQDPALASRALATATVAHML